MDIQKQIKALVGEQDLPYVFGSMNYINVCLDKLHAQKRFPCCVSLQPIAGSIDLTAGAYGGGTIRDTSHIVVGYADSIRFADDAELAQAKAQSLKALCIDLLKRINACGLFDVVEQVSYSVMYDEMDANLVIVLMDFDLQEKQGVCAEV